MNWDPPTEKKEILYFSRRKVVLMGGGGGLVMKGGVKKFLFLYSFGGLFWRGGPLVQSLAKGGKTW